MNFYYEVLDEKQFQKLSQALIAAQFPNAQCFPVGQPDGGGDALAVYADRSEVYRHSNSYGNSVAINRLSTK